MKVITLILTIFLVACSPRAIREAKQTVSQADSLWHAGTPCNDSASLAKAYETLGAIPFLFREGMGLGSLFSHSCYHYGRLLRQKENPVEAMQVFINATHSHTRDYHILGRVYSNMGSICHLASDYALSYDMYEKSTNMFLQNGDSLLYFYGLNNMAFELASLKDIDSCLAIVKKVLCNPIEDYTLLAYCSLTCSRASYETHNYDSAIHYAHYPYLAGESAATLLLAQSYSHLGNRDTAVYYAEMVLRENPTLEESNNALYILTNEDSNKNLQAILKTAADRSDIQKELEIRQGKLAQATQILEQDLNRKPNLNWLYAIIATIIIIGIGLGVYVTNRRKKNKLLKQEFDSLNQATEEIQEKHHALNAQYNKNYKRIEEEIYHTCDMLRNSNNITKDLSWNNYQTMCEIVDKNFYMFASKLRCQKELKETETRLCILVLIGYSRPQIAQILPYAPNSVGKLKDQTAKSLGTTGKNLRNFLFKIAIEG